MKTQKHKLIGVQHTIARAKSYFCLLFIITSFGCQIIPKTDSTPKTFYLSPFELYRDAVMLTADPDIRKTDDSDKIKGARLTSQVKERLLAVGLTQAKEEDADLHLEIYRQTVLSNEPGKMSPRYWKYKWFVSATQSGKEQDYEFHNAEDLSSIIDSLSSGSL